MSKTLITFFITASISFSPHLSASHSDAVEETPDDTLHVYGLPYAAEMANAFLEEFFIQRITGWISTPKSKGERFITESFRTFSGVVLRALKQPAQDRTQSYFQQFFGGNVYKSDIPVEHIERELVYRISDLEGRLGVDAQQSRATYERIVPILGAALESAASAFRHNRFEESVELLAYSARLAHKLYPEMGLQDETTARLVKTTFTDRVELSDAFRKAVKENLLKTEDISELDLLKNWGILKNSDAREEAPAQSPFFKNLALNSLAVAGYLIPALAKTVINKDMRLIYRVMINFIVNQFSQGITGPHSMLITSETQRWMVSHSIHPRVDEEENQGRAHNTFAEYNRKVRALFSPQAQLLRSHLLVMMRALVPSLQDARNLFLEGSEKEALASILSAALYLRSHYPEIQPDDLFVKDLALNFFGKWSPVGEAGVLHLKTLLQTHDPDYENKDVQVYYADLLKNWGIEMDGNLHPEPAQAKPGPGSRP